MKEQGRQWNLMDDELSPAVEIAYNRFLAAKNIQTNDEIDLEWQTEDQRTLGDSIELIKIRSDADQRHYAKVPDKNL